MSRRKRAFRSILAVQRVQILLDHHGHLEHDGVVKLPQVQPGHLLDLFQAVDQGVAVNVQLS